MFTIKSEDIVSIMTKALNCVDHRLVDHGARVSYIMAKILSISESDIDDKSIYDICMVGLFHDIGAYKTDEIDDLFVFDSRAYWPHSIYGYLFLYHMSPLSHLAEAIKFHHLPYNSFGCEYADMTIIQKVALLIKLCDRIDVLLSVGKTKQEVIEHIAKYKDTHFSGFQIDLFIKADEKYDIFKHLSDKTYTLDEAINLQKIKLSEEELVEYLSMLSLSIDFRSPYTVFHTITVVEASIIIAKLLKLDPETVSQIRIGALLHDIGKMGIPVSILEKPGSLNDSEMRIMRSHIDITRQLLEQFIDPVVCEIASRHHERLDGSGYPNGLTEKDLTIPEQLLAVSDVISALKGRRSYKGPMANDTIIKELNFQAGKNKLSPMIVELCEKNFPYISDKIENIIEKIGILYKLIQDDYIKNTEDVSKDIFFTASTAQTDENSNIKPKGLLDLL